MRVIAGVARHLPLKTVDSKDVRPTTDRIKETLFNILMPYINGCRFLDLFAGSGGIGIEALSRGAVRAVFVDNSRASQSVITDNLAFTRLAGRAELMKTDVISAIRRLNGREQFDIIFMDPPYESGQEIEALKEVAASDILAEDGLVIIEASRYKPVDYAESLGFSIRRDKVYKHNRHLFLKRVADLKGTEL